MALVNGSQTIDGKIVIVTLDNDNKVIKVEFPDIKDAANNPLSVTFTPGLLQSDAEQIIATIIALLG